MRGRGKKGLCHLWNCEGSPVTIGSEDQHYVWLALQGKGRDRLSLQLFKIRLKKRKGRIVCFLLNGDFGKRFGAEPSEEEAVVGGSPEDLCCFPMCLFSGTAFRQAGGRAGWGAGFWGEVGKGCCCSVREARGSGGGASICGSRSPGKEPS